MKILSKLPSNTVVTLVYIIFSIYKTCISLNSYILTINSIHDLDILIFTLLIIFILYFIINEYLDNKTIKLIVSILSVFIPMSIPIMVVMTSFFSMLTAINIENNKDK